MANRHKAQKRGAVQTAEVTSGNMNVIREAKQKKDGGAVPGGKSRGGGTRLDKRARGGGVGADKSPFSSAHLK